MPEIMRSYCSHQGTLSNSRANAICEASRALAAMLLSSFLGNRQEQRRWICAWVATAAKWTIGPCADDPRRILRAACAEEG